MIQRLFVYGTLAPNRANAHMLSSIEGFWEKATAKGILQHEGWGSAMGYPGFIPNENGEIIHGYVLTATTLCEHWNRLDDFEGKEYERILIPITLESGGIVDAYIYALA